MPLLARVSVVAPPCLCLCALSDVRSLCAPTLRCVRLGIRPSPPVLRPSLNVPLTSCADRLCAHSRRQPRLSSMVPPRNTRQLSSQSKQLTRSAALHLEYAERGKEYGILFIFSLFCEYIHLEYVRIHGIYRGNQAGYVTHIRVVAPQEYVHTYSTHRSAAAYSRHETHHHNRRQHGFSALRSAVVVRVV